MLTVTDFYADWCGPCQNFKPTFETVKEKFKDKVKFQKVNVDENRDKAAEHGVMSIPTVIFEKEGKEVERQGFMNESDFVKLIEKHI